MPEEFIFTSDTRPDMAQLSQAVWFRISGGGLSAPVFVRLGRGRDGRPVLNGLLMGVDVETAPVEITSETLRSVRVGALLTEFFTLRWEPCQESVTEDDFEELLDRQEMWSAAARSASPTRSAARGPSETELARFAEVYREQIVRNPRRAMSATAQQMRVSRATANRWADQCRARGLLDPKSGDGAPNQ